KEAAIADMVNKYNIGIVAEDLSSLDEIIGNLTEEEYKCVNKSKEWKDYFAKYSRTNGIMFRRGLIAFLISSENNEVSYKELSSIIKHK
ncbi:MAG: hypothetical protein RR578_03830, partial [Bacilli bacterium]